ncbi:CASP8AP2 [Branchiostoma lanceolatum]|uniref:CASP8AP2 protein n=1 Tax=Branchiostoma lanceolatum TaxID=7740 RepID=A0A8J9V902_BRALA|nr:CASP8AP2 [Branchiostoma lanceolatum]
MEDPERSNLSSLDLYSDMLGETEEMNEGGGRGTTKEHSVMSSMDLYSDMLGETEEMSDRDRRQADPCSDMLGETEGMSEERRGQVEEQSVLSSMDLYEDIIEEERENEKFEELRSEVTKTAGQMEELMSQMENIQTEKQSLAKENQALKKNISALFVTAKAELDRKQKEIARLRADLEMMQMRRGVPRIPHSRPPDNRDDYSRPGPSGRDSTTTREATSTQREQRDRRPGAYRQNNMGSHQQGESPDRDRSKREGTGVLKSHPEHSRTQTGDLRCSKSPEKDQDRGDGTKDRTCRSKDTNPELKRRETRKQTAEKLDSVHHTDRLVGDGTKPRQLSQDKDKLKTKEREEMQNTVEKSVEHFQERNKSTEHREEEKSPHGPHTPSYPYPNSEEDVKESQTSPKETVLGGPKTPPEPYPYEDADKSRNLRKDSEKQHEVRSRVVGDEESRRHSGEGKKDSAYCSSSSESLSRHSRENSVEDKRDEYKEDRKRDKDTKFDSKIRKQSRDSSREKHQKDGRNSHEKRLEDKKTEHEQDRRKEDISSGDLRQKLRQKKQPRDRSQDKSSDDRKNGDHDKGRRVEQRDRDSRRSKESKHGKESSSRTTERGREKHRDEKRSAGRDRSNARLPKEGRNSSRGDKSERTQQLGDTREAHKRKRSSSGEQKHLEERRKVSPPRKKQYEKDHDRHQQSRERRQSRSRHRDRSEEKNKEKSRHRSSGRSNRLHDNSKEPEQRGHRSKFVNYRDRSEGRDSGSDRYRSLSVETNSTSGSSSASSVAAYGDVQKHLPTSFKGSLRSSRSREADGLQERVPALTSSVSGRSFNEEPMEKSTADSIGEGTGALDDQAKAGESQEHYKNGDRLPEKHLTSPQRGRDDGEKSIQNSPDCATDRSAAVSSQLSVTAGYHLQDKYDESETEEVTSTTTEQPDRRATVREKLLSESAEELGLIMAPVKRKRDDIKQGHFSSPAAKKKKASQNTPTKKGRLSPRKSLKESPSKKVTCSPKKSPHKIPQEVAESSEITPKTLVSPRKTPKKLSPQTSPKKAAISPTKSPKKIFKSPQKTPRKSAGTPKKKSKSPRKTENLVEKCRSIVWTGKSAKGKTVNLFHIEYETADNAAREVFRNSPLLSPVKPPTPQLNLSSRSSDVELPSGDDSCSLPLPAISAQLKTDKVEMERPVPCYHGNLSFSSFHGNTDTSQNFVRTERVHLQQEEQRLSEGLKSVTSSQPPFVSSEDTCRRGSSLEEQDFPRNFPVPFSGGSEMSESQQHVSVHLPTTDIKQQTNSSESTGPFEVSINAEDADKLASQDPDLKDNMQTQGSHTSTQKWGDDKDQDHVSTEGNSADLEESEKTAITVQREEPPIKTDEELRRNVQSSLLSISNDFDSSTANLSNEELFAVEVLAQLAAAAKTPTQSPVKSAVSPQQTSPRKGGAKKSPMKVAVTGSTPYRLFSPGRVEPTIAAEVEVGSGCTQKKGSRQRKGMDSPFIPPQHSALSKKTEKEKHDSKKEKMCKKSSDKDPKKADEMMSYHKKKDRKYSKQSAEVLAIPEQDSVSSKAKNTKTNKVPQLEVKPVRSSPMKTQGKVADAAKPPKASPRESPRKASTVTPVKSREATYDKKSPSAKCVTATTDVSKQKTKDSKHGEKDEGITTVSLQERQTLVQPRKEASKTSKNPPILKNDSKASPSCCVWQVRQTPETETEATCTDLEQNSCPDRLYDNLEEMHNTIVLSPKSNGLQIRAVEKNTPQSEKSGHDTGSSKAKVPSLSATFGVTNSTQILSSCSKTVQSYPELNQRGSLTVPISSKNLQQTGCSSKDNPGTELIGKTGNKVHDVQNTKETVPNNSLKKQIQELPEQVVTSTSSLQHPPHNSPGTKLVEKHAPKQATEYNSSKDQGDNTPDMQHGEGGRVDLFTSKSDNKVELLPKVQKTECVASTEQNQTTADKKRIPNKETQSQTAKCLEKKENDVGDLQCTSDEEELDTIVKQKVQKCKPQSQMSLSKKENVEQEHEGECTSSDEEELDTTVLLPCSTSEENGAHNSIEMETAASFNSDTSLPRPSTPCGLRQEMTLDQFSVLDPDDLRCQSAMSIDVRLIPSTPSGKMGPPSRGGTPSGKDAAPTPGKSQPSLPKTPAEKRQSGAFRQLFNSPPGGRFASTPAAERPKPPKFQLDVSFISTAKEDDSRCLDAPAMGETVDKTMQDIRDTVRDADTVKLCEAANIAVQGSSKLHTKDVKHLETYKECRETEEEKKTPGEKKNRTSPGSGRADTIVASSPKLAPPRRVPSKTDAFRRHLAVENSKKDAEDAKKHKEDSHKKPKSVRTPEKRLERKALDPSDFFPDVSSDEDDVSDVLGDHQEEIMEAPAPKSKVSLGSISARHVSAHVPIVSSIRKQSLSSEVPWQQQVEETAKHKSADMPRLPSVSPSAKVSNLLPAPAIKQISTKRPASAVHPKDKKQGASSSDRQAGVSFGKAVLGTDNGSNCNTIIDTAAVEAGSNHTTTAQKERATGVRNVASETGPVAWHEQDVVPNTVVASAGISGTEAPMPQTLSPDQIPSFSKPPSIQMSTDILPSVPANIQTQSEAESLPNKPLHSLCTVSKPHGGVAFPHDLPSTFLPHNTLSEPCVQNSVIPTPLASKVEHVPIQQGLTPPISSADGIFRIPLPPVNRDPPPQPVLQPTPPVYVAERPVIKLNKFSYAAICALEANYGYEWLWPVKPQQQETLTAKQEPDFLSMATGSEQTKLFVTTCESNVEATQQPHSLQSHQSSPSTQILQPVVGGVSADMSSVTNGNRDDRNDSSVVGKVSHAKDRTSGVVTTKIKGKTVKDLLSESRKQKGKSHQQSGLVAGRGAMSANTGLNNQVQQVVPQTALPSVTGVLMPGVSQVPGVLSPTVENTAQIVYSADRNIFDALTRESIDVSSTPGTGTPILANQQENKSTESTVALPNNPNQQKQNDVQQPHKQAPEIKTCNERITSPNPDIWYEAFGSPKAAAQCTERSETQKTIAHKDKGTVDPNASVNKCLEENCQETEEGELSEGEIISDDEDVKSSETSSYTAMHNINNKDSHCREQMYTSTFKRNEDVSGRHNNRQHSEQRTKDNRDSHRSRSQKAADMKCDRKQTDRSRHGSRRLTSEEGRLREQNYKEGWRRAEGGRTEHGRREKVSRDRAAASREGEQVSRKARRIEKKARR